MAHSQATVKEKSCPPARATPALVFGAALLAPQPRSIQNSEMTSCQNSKEIVAFPYCTIAFWGFAKGGQPLSFGRAPPRALPSYNVY